jgi:dolichol-phosphate mannosyltransferase
MRKAQKNSPEVVVVLPTYNEKDNIGPLIEQIMAINSDKNLNLAILVVDDHSPDNTALEVKKMQSLYPNLHLLIGKRVGLGRAYIRGIVYALENLKPRIVIQMDADFSHNPQDLPRLISEITYSDLIIGSRYVQGGSIPDNWSWLRKVNSRYGNLVARIIGGIKAVKDCTSGFRAIKTCYLDKVNLRAIKASGYYFQVELLARLVYQGASVSEIPILFQDRIRGKSKLGLRDIGEFLLFIFGLRIKKLFWKLSGK